MTYDLFYFSLFEMTKVVFFAHFPLPPSVIRSSSMYYSSLSKLDNIIFIKS